MFVASQWLYQRAGQQFGPVSTEQLQGLAQSGQLQPTDMVWTEGMGNWMEAGKAGGIFDTAPPQPIPQQPIPQQPIPQQPIPQQPIPQQPAPPQPFGQPIPQQPIPGVQQPGMGQPIPQQPFVQQPVSPQQPIIPQQPVPQGPAAQGPIPQPIPGVQQPAEQQPIEPEPKKKKKKPAEWYFMKGEKRCGPISSQTLQERANIGRLQPDHLVWREGLDEWLPAKKVQGLFPKNMPVPKVSISTSESTLPDIAGPPVPKPKSKPRAATSPGSKRKKRTATKKKGRPQSKPAAGPEVKKKEGKKKEKDEKKEMPDAAPAAEKDSGVRIGQLREKLDQLRQAIVRQVLEESDELSDVKAVAQFCGARSALQKEIDKAKDRAEQLQRVQAELDPVETPWRERSNELAAAETGLEQSTEMLGKTAFDAWITGNIPDNEIFAQRLEVHQDIMDLEQQRERLEAQADAGKVEEAKAKAEGQTIAGKLKTEEAKIAGLDAEVGRKLTVSPNLINVERAGTSEVIARINELKSKVKELRPQVEAAQTALDAKKKDLAKSLNVKNLSSGDVLAAEIQQCEKMIEGKEKERLALEEKLPEKLLADKYAPDEGKLSDLLDDYEDADEELKELAPEGSIFGGLQSAAAAALAMVRATWQGLKGWQKIAALAVLAAVLLAVAYLAFPSGGGTPEPETPATPAEQQPGNTPADAQPEPLKTQTGPVTAPIPK